MIAFIKIELFYSDECYHFNICIFKSQTLPPEFLLGVVEGDFLGTNWCKLMHEVFRGKTLTSDLLDTVFIKLKKISAEV